MQLLDSINGVVGLLKDSFPRVCRDRSSDLVEYYIKIERDRERGAGLSDSI